MKKLSVVIPTFNEEKNVYFRQTLESLKGFAQVEIIVSDGGSEDKTLEIAGRYPVKIVEEKTNSRAVRINNGINSARGELVLLNHPRTLIEPAGVEHLLNAKVLPRWGGFTHAFDVSHPLLRFTSWYSNNIRVRYRGVVYLDHCKFARREDLILAGALPPVEIFEDTILSKSLGVVAGPPSILPFIATTSAIRFIANGPFRQALLNQALKAGYFLGGGHRVLNQFYERKTRLNSSYRE